MLLQRGADIGIREKTGSRTAMELAANDKTRELIIFYCSPPYSVSKEDLTYMNLAIKGMTAAKGKKPVGYLGIHMIETFGLVGPLV